MKKAATEAAAVILSCSCALSASNRQNGHDLECVEVAILILDGDILTRLKGMAAKAVPRLVIILTFNVVVERPRPSRTMDQVAQFLFFISPEPTHAAMLALFLPDRGINMPGIVQRGSELIPMTGGPLRVLLRARQIEANFPERIE